MHPRLLRVITRLNIGGPARQAIYLTKSLASEFNTRLLVGHLATGEALLDSNGISYNQVSLVREINFLMDSRALLEISAHIHSFKPDIIHTHMAKAGFLTRVAAKTTKRKPAMIHTYHGHVLEGYFSPRRQQVFIALERKLANITDVLVAVSEEIKLELLELNIGHPEQYRVIPVGLDLSPFLKIKEYSGKLRTQIGIDSDTPLLGTVGRLTQIKDHKTMIAAMQFLKGVHLAIIGDGELRSELEFFTSQLNLQSRVHFLGWKIVDLADLVSDFDVAVLTSKNEGTPLALIEALASGKPGVATDVGGVRSVLQDNFSGFLVPTEDPKILADKITILLNSKSLRERFGNNGRTYVAKHFSQERLASDIKALYKELC